MTIYSHQLRKVGLRTSNTVSEKIDNENLVTYIKIEPNIAFAAAAAPHPKLAPRDPYLNIFGRFLRFRTFRRFRAFSSVFARFRTFSSVFWCFRAFSDVLDKISVRQLYGHSITYVMLCTYVSTYIQTVSCFA